MINFAVTVHYYTQQGNIGSISTHTETIAAPDSYTAMDRVLKVVEKVPNYKEVLSITASHSRTYRNYHVIATYGTPRGWVRQFNKTINATSGEEAMNFVRDFLRRKRKASKVWEITATLTY